MEGYCFKKENTKNPGQIIKVNSFSKNIAFYYDKKGCCHRIFKNKILPCWFEEGDILHNAKGIGWKLTYDDLKFFTDENFCKLSGIDLTEFSVPRENLETILKRIQSKFAMDNGKDKLDYDSNYDFREDEYVIINREKSKHHNKFEVCVETRPTVIYKDITDNEAMISRDGGLDTLTTDNLDTLRYQNGYEIDFKNIVIDFTEDILYGAINIAEKSARVSGWIYANSDNCMEFFNEKYRKT